MHSFSSCTFSGHADGLAPCPGEQQGGHPRGDSPEVPHPLPDPASASAAGRSSGFVAGSSCQEAFGLARGVMQRKPRRIFPNFFGSGVKAAATLLLLPFENKSVGFSFQLRRAKIIDKIFFFLSFFLVLMSPQPTCFFTPTGASRGASLPPRQGWVEASRLRAQRGTHVPRPVTHGL